MTDLDSALRTMFAERAQDVRELPPGLLDLESGRDGGLPGARGAAPVGRRPPRSAWLVAAAVAVVLAVAGGLLASDRGNRPAPSPATRTTTSATPAPAAPHAVRKVKLSWFGMRSVAGFDQHEWLSDPGYRTVAVRARADRDSPVGCNGCEQATAYIHVFDAGVFDPAKYRVTTWSRTTVAGQTAYVGTMVWYGVGKHQVPTLAWQFRAGEWALVQGVTPLGGRTSTLKRLAAAVRPTESVPIGLPFRLDYVPDAPITQITDDRSEGYAFTMDFSTGRADGLSFDVTLWNRNSFAGVYDTTGTASHDIGGLPGRIGDDGIGVRYHGGVAILGVSADGELNATVGDQDAQAKATADQRAALERVASGIHWTGGDGRAPYAPAEDAIP